MSAQGSNSTDSTMAPTKPAKQDASGNGGLAASSSTNANIKN
jgi:hypothetical protein